MDDAEDFAMAAPAADQADPSAAERARWRASLLAALVTGGNSGGLAGVACAAAYYAENRGAPLPWLPLFFVFVAFVIFMGALFAFMSQLAILLADRVPLTPVIAAAVGGGIGGIPSGVIGAGYFGKMEAPFVLPAFSGALFLVGGAFIAFAGARRAWRGDRRSSCRR